MDHFVTCCKQVYILLVLEQELFPDDLLICMEQFTTRHQVVHNGRFQNFKELLFHKKTTCIAQILCSLSYKLCSITVPKLKKLGLLILILGISAIMDRTACCYNVTTSKTGLYR